MKRPGPALCVVALLATFCLIPSPRHEDGIVIADQSVTTIMNAQTVVGPGIASIYTAVTPTEDPKSSFFFQYHGSSQYAKARLEIYNGSTWKTLHDFALTDEVFRYPVCGVCQFRGYATFASATDTSTITVMLSGSSVAVAPTYTITPTGTSTPVATATPVNTPTNTPTNTMTATPAPPTPTRTPTNTPTATPTFTPSNTPTATPTVTPTQTATNTPVPHVLTLNMNLAGTGTNDEVATVSGAYGGTCGHGLACQFTIPNGATVTITQTAGSDAGTWSGTSGCTGATSTPCVITNMTAVKTATATF